MPTNQDFIDNKYKYARVLNGDFEGKICKKSMTHFGDKKTSIWVDDSVFWMNNSDLQTVFYIGDNADTGEPKFLEVDGYVIGVGDILICHGVFYEVSDFYKLYDTYRILVNEEGSRKSGAIYSIEEVTLHQPLYQSKEEETITVAPLLISSWGSIPALGIPKTYKKSEYDAAIKNVKEVE